MKKPIKKLDYRTRNAIQNIAIAHGILLSEEQLCQFASYRGHPAFAATPDANILYVVMTHAQRESFDRRRFE